MPPIKHLIALATQYAYWSKDGYELINNTWGQDAATSGNQTTYYDGVPSCGKGIAWSSDWEWQGGENNVKSFVYGARQFERRLVSDIHTLPTESQWHYDREDIRANVAYDIFTDTDKDHVNSSGEYELMIWLGRFGGVMPLTEAKRPIAHVNIAGYDWEVYFGYNHGGAMKVYSFLPAQGNIYDFRADVKLFFSYLTKEHQFPADKQYMLVYQLGTEAFTGGPAKFVVPKFIADVR
ncbi:endoglucanase-1 [Verticillium alfalfae VaMs.102]|uniref:Endoglucanase-1 n=1 Tax=Verticillium alfalfae (strain VaMs.102 / ATCC MYA-4576 / FGSC 10136) TaxID=526221 RepID=C9SDT3_VERA1|nr:endoglucanase-1 [Verticillium alfalfae VaMs.102]EEY17203.1 endoglucanase-1 [Verticillium alfalfae VaMs.102]